MTHNGGSKAWSGAWKLWDTYVHPLIQYTYNLIYIYVFHMSYTLILHRNMIIFLMKTQEHPIQRNLEDEALSSSQAALPKVKNRWLINVFPLE